MTTQPAYHLFSRFGINPDRVKAQYAANYKQLCEMLAKAKELGKPKYRGFTISELEAAVAKFEQLSK